MNVSNLELILVQKISNSTSTLDTLIYSKALQELKTGTVTVVNTTADLPNPNTAFVGHLFYEKTTEAIYFVDSNGYSKILATTATLFAWGVNSSGRLGDGTTTSRSSPVSTAGGGTNWCVSAAGSGSGASAAIKTDGTLWTWGYNGAFAPVLGDGTNTTRCSPGTVAGGGTTWCAVSIGIDHAVAVKTDGTLWTWGYNSWGQLGTGVTFNQRSSPGTTVGGGSNWSKISANRCYTAAIKTDGTLWTWGRNECGKLGDGTSSNRSSPDTVAGGGTTWCHITTGWYHTAGVKSDGTLWTWGYNNYGQLGTGTSGPGTGRSSPGSVAGGGSTWRAAAAGRDFTIAVKTDGTLWAWGDNGYGRLGDGTTTCRTSPVTVAGGGTTWCAVGVGEHMSGAVKTDGTLWTWGRNDFGQLGDGTTTSRCSPGTVTGGIANWTSVAMAGVHTVAVKVNF